MAQWGWRHLCSARGQVGSLTWKSGERVRYCWGIGCSCGWDLTPGPGNSIYNRMAKKEKKKNVVLGVPAVAQLVSVEAPVRSPAQHSGLRIWYCCCSCGVGHMALI